MKYGNKLFGHLPFAFNQKMEFFTCISKLKKLLPPTLAGGIKNAFIKNDTLYFVMENKALEFEANYKLNTLTPLLKEFCKKESGCEEVKFSKIRAYSKNEPKKERPVTTFLEKERSDGKFENNFTNPVLKEKLELIRKEIMKNASKA